MTKNVRNWSAVLALVFAVGLVGLSGSGRAAGKDDVNAEVRKIAAAIKDGKMDAAEKLAVKVAKQFDDVEGVMHLFKRRDKGGLGFGTTPITPATKDGIETKLQELGRDTAALGKDAAAIEQAGYDTAAIALITKALAPTKAQGKKTPADWKKFSDDMRESSTKFAQKSKAGAQEVKTAARLVTQACVACHSMFKE